MNSVPSMGYSARTVGISALDEQELGRHAEDPGGAVEFGSRGLAGGTAAVYRLLRKACLGSIFINTVNKDSW